MSKVNFVVPLQVFFTICLSSRAAEPDSLAGQGPMLFNIENAKSFLSNLDGVLDGMIKQV